MKVWIVLCLAGLLCIGCGSEASSSANCDGGCWRPSAAQKEFIASFCGLSEACCVAAGRKQQGDPAACAASLQANGVTADPSLRSACLAEMGRRSSSMSCLPEASDFSGPCSRVFYEPDGPQGPGAPCRYRADCAGKSGSVTVCVTDPSLLKRNICMQTALGKVGDHTCLGDVTPDGAIFSAPRYSGTGTPISAGVVCPHSQNLRCEYTNDPTTSACVPLSAGGAGCQIGATCASGMCVNELGAAGAGTCAEIVADGQTCGEPFKATCDATSFCDGDSTNGYVCRPKLPAGAKCGSDASCQGGTCSDETCSPQTSAEMLALFAFCTTHSSN